MFSKAKQKMTTLGFIGLGVMGSRMAKRLLEAGHSVIGTNRTHAKAVPLVAAGMRWADSPRVVAEAADIIFSIVTDTPAFVAIMDCSDGILSGLRAGNVFIDMSTVSPSAKREASRRVAAKGAAMIDAPVSGSPAYAAQGALVIYAGGDANVVKEVEPVLLQLGQKVIYTGEVGSAATLKIAINLNLVTQLISLFEGILLAEKSGIPRAQALDGILNSVAASPHMKYRAPFILDPPEEIWFNVKMMQKDVLLALDLAREVDAPLHTVAHANEVLNAARAMGYAEEDFSAVFKVLAKMANVR
jgi:3-hydroxyisobutyrate dehydrogenase-like beta-hydroxyacid dehydrogenase